MRLPSFLWSTELNYQMHSIIATQLNYGRCPSNPPTGEATIGDPPPQRRYWNDAFVFLIALPHRCVWVIPISSLFRISDFVLRISLKASPTGQRSCFHPAVGHEHGRQPCWTIFWEISLGKRFLGG